MQTSRGKNSHPDSPEDILREYAGYDLCGKSECGNYQLAQELIAKLDEYYTNKFLEIVGDDEDGYESPDWKIPHTAEMLVAYAEGWDKCKQHIRTAIKNLNNKE